MRQVTGPFIHLASFVDDKLVTLKVGIPPPKKFPFAGQIIVDLGGNEGIILCGLVQKIVPNHKNVSIKVAEIDGVQTIECRHEQIVSIRVFSEKGEIKGLQKNRRKMT